MAGHRGVIGRANMVRGVFCAVAGLEIGSALAFDPVVGGGAATAAEAGAGVPPT